MFKGRRNRIPGKPGFSEGSTLPRSALEAPQMLQGLSCHVISKEKKGKNPSPASHLQAFSKGVWSPTMPHQNHTCVPKFLIFEPKIKLERLTAPALGSTFPCSFPNLTPGGKTQPLVLLHTSKPQISRELFGLLSSSPSSWFLHVGKPSLPFPGAGVVLPCAPRS